MSELPVRLVRQWNIDAHLTLADLRGIVAECDRRRLAGDSLVSVDDRAEWVSGVDAEGHRSKKYPKGDGGHYVTRIEVDGHVDAELPLPTQRFTTHDYSGGAGRCRRCGVARQQGVKVDCVAPA